MNQAKDEILHAVLATRDEVRAMAGTLDSLDKRIGYENDDGTGGSGLAGKVARHEKRLNELDAMRNWVMGAAAVVGAGIGMFFVQIKHWMGLS